MTCRRPSRPVRLRRFLIRHGFAYEIALTALAGIWVALGLALREASDEQTRALLSLSGGIGLVHLADFAARARASGAPRVYGRHHAFVPLLAVAGVLPLEPLVQLARLGLALLGLRRVLARAGGIFARFPRLDELISLSLVAWAAGGILIFELEVGTNPRITSVTDGLWWALATISTVGYGDIAPVTPLGRLVASGVITIGVGLFAAAVALIGRSLSEEGGEDAWVRLARIAELERRHADGSVETEELIRRIRELAADGRESSAPPPGRRSP